MHLTACLEKVTLFWLKITTNYAFFKNLQKLEFFLKMKALDADSHFFKNVKRGEKMTFFL